MTTRNDVTVDWNESPRIAEVAAPSDEFVMQDVVDTLRKKEDSFRGLSEDRLLDAAGKEDLGGGVKVGITVSLQNTLVAFQGRTTAAQIGTVTSGSGTPIGEIPHYTFTDTSATFVTNNVVRGSMIINFDDQSIAEVYRTESETELTTKVLVNGISNTWGIGDAYQVYNVTQVRATGGNLVAVDGNGSPLSSGVLPTWATQVLVTSSASATLQELADIQFSSFNGGVTVDIANSTGVASSGTIFPTGTERQPVDNFIDALTIAKARGFLTFYVIGDAVVDSSQDFTDYRFIGQGQNLSTLTLDPGATFVNATYADATITGTLDGEAHIEDCIIEDLTFVSGVIQNCILAAGTITLGGSSEAHFINCASGVPGANTPIIDMGGSGQALALRNYNGGIELQNKTGSESVSLDMNSGQVILDSTITNGVVIARGVGKLIDNSVGATVSNELVSGLFMKGLLTVKKYLALK